MKILIVTGIVFPEIGGPATFIPKLKQFAESLKHECWVVSQGQQINKKKDTNTTIINQDNSFLIKRIRIIYQIWTQARKSDRVFSNGMFEETAIAICMQRKKSVAKIVGDPVWERYRNRTGSQTGIMEFNNSKLSTTLNIQRKLLVWSLNRFTTITTPSPQLENLMESWGVRKPIKVIENGVEINNHLDVQQTRGVCVISRLVSWKNIDIVIKACEKAKVNCTIVGDGPEMERLKIIAASSKTKVEFMGKLDSKGVQNILYSSEIYILFSSYEGLSFSLLEAMAAKKAIIVSDVEGNRQVITNEKNGLIVTVGNLEKLTSAIKNLSDNPTIRKTLGENAETTVRMKYSNSIQIGKILELIK